MTVSPPSGPVSVIVPAYNYARYLGVAINSVLKQTHTDLEVIVVDDGSTDHTAQIVASFSDPRIRYIYQTNAGLSAARNTGIRVASHAFVAFLDADDAWLPNHLSSAVAQFSRLDPSFGLVASATERIDTSGKILPVHRPGFPDGEFNAADIVLKTRFMPSAVLVRRSVFEACGTFDTTLRSSEDRDMWIRIGQRFRIFAMSIITAQIRKHPENMSRQADRMRSTMSIVVRRAYAVGIMPRWHLLFWCKAWALHFFQAAWMYHDEGRSGKAVRCALWAFCLYPWPLSGTALNEPQYFRSRALLRFAGLLAPRPLKSPVQPQPESSNPPGVSVVIPAYNYAHYLPRAIASVLAQTRSDLELIIVDDGSTDDTRRIVAAIADPRVRYVWQKNAGLSASRNTGIREAQFAFVAFLDADDLWAPGLLDAVMPLFAALPEEFAAIATGTTRIDSDDQPYDLPDYTMLHTGELTARDFCLRNRPLSSSIVLRRDVFSDCGGFDTTLRSSEDRDMWIRLTTRGHRFYYFEKSLAFIRRHPHNMSKNAPRMKLHSQQILWRAWRNGVVSRFAVVFWLRSLAIHYFLVAWTHFDDGLRTRALGYWLASIAVWPFFLRPRQVFEQPFFRCRALRHFLMPKPV